MNCICRVSVLKTHPSRSECGDAGTLCDVTGMLTGLQLPLCHRHRRQLQRLGLTVEKCTPLEQNTAKAEFQRADGLRTIPVRPAV
jgi:hypothetical protein